MGYPRRFEQPLKEYGYKMEVDIRKWDCHREPIHWHLCKNGQRIGQIWVPSATWEDIPPVSSSIMKEAEELTRRYSSEITDTYLYNKENGAD